MNAVDFKHGSIGRTMLSMAVPTLIAQSVSLLYNIVDRIWIGRIPRTGLMALSAVGICFPVVVMITALSNLFGMGGSPLYALALGKGDPKEARSIFQSSFRMLFWSSLVVMMAGELLAPQILLWSGADETLMPDALAYLRIYLSGNVFSMLAAGLNPFLNAMGYPKISMLSIMLGGLLNLVLDPVFIFTFGLGVSGAAAATVISQLASAVLVLGFVRHQDPGQLTLMSEGSHTYFPFWKKILALGTAPFVMQCTNSLVQVVSNSVLMDLGSSVSVSVMTVLFSVRQILETPILAITEGTSPLLSYNYGARRPERVWKTFWLMFGVCLLYTVVVWDLIEWFPGWFVSIFSSDPALAHTAIPALRIFLGGFVFQTLQYAGQTVFKALDKKNQAVFFSIFRKVIVVIPLTYLLPRFITPAVNGVFYAEPASNIIGGTLCFVMMLATIVPELRRMPKEQHQL